MISWPTSDVVIVLDLPHNIADPLCTEDDRERLSQAVVDEASQSWPLFTPKQSRSERISSIKEDCLTGGNLTFNDALLASHPSVFSLYIESVGELEAYLTSVSVTVIFTSKLAGTCSHSIWSPPKTIGFRAGKFKTAVVRDALNDLKESFSEQCWTLAEVVERVASASVKTLILTANPVLEDLAALQVASQLIDFTGRSLYCSAILFGQASTESLQGYEEFAAYGGGFALSISTSQNDNVSIVSAIVPSFLACAISEIHERQLYHHRRCHQLFRFGEKGFHRLADISGASQTTRADDPGCGAGPAVVHALVKADAHVRWRWIRTLQTYRDSVTGVRDIRFADEGPIGIELCPPRPHHCDHWIVFQTHPPASSLNILKGSRVICINGHPITGSTSRFELHRLLRSRPVIISLTDCPSRLSASDAWIWYGNSTRLFFISRPLSSTVAEYGASRLIARTLNPYGKSPPKAQYHSTQKPWNGCTKSHKLHHMFALASCITRDLCMFAKLRQVSKEFR